MNAREYLEYVSLGPGPLEVPIEWLDAYGDSVDHIADAHEADYEALPFGTLVRCRCKRWVATVPHDEIRTVYWAGARSGHSLHRIYAIRAFVVWLRSQPIIRPRGLR